MPSELNCRSTSTSIWIKITGGGPVGTSTSGAGYDFTQQDPAVGGTFVNTPTGLTGVGNAYHRADLSDIPSGVYARAYPGVGNEWIFEYDPGPGATETASLVTNLCPILGYDPTGTATTDLLVESVRVERQNVDLPGGSIGSLACNDDPLVCCNDCYTETTCDACPVAPLQMRVHIEGAAGNDAAGCPNCDSFNIDYTMVYVDGCTWESPVQLICPTSLPQLGRAGYAVLVLTDTVARVEVWISDPAIEPLLENPDTFSLWATWELDIDLFNCTSTNAIPFVGFTEPVCDDQFLYTGTGSGTIDTIPNPVYICIVCPDEDECDDSDGKVSTLPCCSGVCDESPSKWWFNLNGVIDGFPPPPLGPDQCLAFNATNPWVMYSHPTSLITCLWSTLYNPIAGSGGHLGPRLDLSACYSASLAICQGYTSPANPGFAVLGIQCLGGFGRCDFSIGVTYKLRMEDWHCFGVNTLEKQPGFNGCDGVCAMFTDFTIASECVFPDEITVIPWGLDDNFACSF